MKTSDARYRHVQRTKRDPFDYVDLVKAMRVARLDPRELEPLEQAVRDSTREFTHVLLATGQTANDFRRNFRVGANGVNILRANDLVAHDALQAEKLDGYVVMRISREQHKNLKLRWAKLRNQDRLYHDPQGTLWMSLMRGWAKAIGEDEILRELIHLRDSGVQLTRADEDDHQKRLERASKELVRFAVSQAFIDDMDWDEAKIHKEGRDSFFGARVVFREGAERYVSVDEWRKRIEERLVVSEAYVDGECVKAAWANPDTSKRHSTTAQLQARFDRIDKLYGDQWRAERAAIREARKVKRAT
ncbi:hypothetical protein [Sphingomonas oryzagri]